MVSTQIKVVVRAIDSFTSQLIFVDIIYVGNIYAYSEYFDNPIVSYGI